MANTASAEKRHRQSLKRRARNIAVRTEVRDAIKEVRSAVASGDKTKAATALKGATKIIARAASKGVYHARNADRHISRLAKSVNGKAAAKA